MNFCLFSKTNWRLWIHFQKQETSLSFWEGDTRGIAAHEDAASEKRGFSQTYGLNQKEKLGKIVKNRKGRVMNNYEQNKNMTYKRTRIWVRCTQETLMTTGEKWSPWWRRVDDDYSKKEMRKSIVMIVIRRRVGEEDVQWRKEQMGEWET